MYQNFISNVISYLTRPRIQVGDESKNTLVGSWFSDQLSGLGDNDTLIGKSGRDVLLGGNGNDFLNGGLGADTLNGGDGIDTATFADSCKAVTVNLLTGVSKGGDAEGDRLISIENLTGSKYADKLTGDGGANILDGQGGNDELWGGDGNDTVIGGSGKDLLYGGTGDDHLIGDTGTDADYNCGAVDVMQGGSGNDTYSVYQAGDVVLEQAGEGADTVLASIDYVLSANIESLAMFGSARLGVGNDMANIIRGTDGDNVIVGKGGHDSLYGQGGADTFVFDTADATSSDIVRDFVSGVDKVGLSVSGFDLHLAPGGTLPDDLVFVDGALPANSDPGVDHGQFILLRNNPTTSSLLWDADGSGAVDPVLLATFIGANPQVSDFVLTA